MEKELKTKEEIWNDPKFGHSFYGYTEQSNRAMTEWGNQEYNQGYDKGKQDAKIWFSIGIIVGIVFTTAFILFFNSL